MKQDVVVQAKVDKSAARIPVERYSSRPVRRTSQAAGRVFSALVFAAVFAAVLIGGVFASGGLTVWGVVAAVLCAALSEMSVHVAQEWEKVVVLRLGKYHKTAGPGPYMTIPFIDHIALCADQRVLMTGFSAEETLTSDLVPINVDAVLFWMVWDAKKACLEVEDYYNAVALVAQTALRDAIGRSTASEVAIRRNQLDEELQRAIEESASTWGITIMSVEIRDIVLPKELQEAMSAEARAEREKNARIVLAEVEKDISAMLVEAAEIYDGNECALRLRTMHLLNESVREAGGAVVVPSAYSEGFASPTPPSHPAG